MNSLTSNLPSITIIGFPTRQNTYRRPGLKLTFIFFKQILLQIHDKMPAVKSLLGYATVHKLKEGTLSLRVMIKQL